MKNLFIILGLIIAFIAGYFFSQNYNLKIENKRNSLEPTKIISPKEEKPLVGNDEDKYGCKGSAGYTWCEVKQKCLRLWEEPCEKVDNEKDIKQVILNKHSWTQDEVDITISKENGIFARGGIKEKEAVSGGMFLAKKIDGKWEIVFEGNGAPDCNLLKNTYFFLRIF